MMGCEEGSCEEGRHGVGVPKLGKGLDCDNLFLEDLYIRAWNT